uniref:Glycine rich superfamily member n=1 Tax=Rhipicephalus zambeziensis TaxID=60191 RepID=A0A224Y9K6_9ACAR
MKAFFGIAVALVLVAQCGFAQGRCTVPFICPLKAGDARPTKKPKPHIKLPPNWPWGHHWPQSGPKIGGWVPPPAYYQPDMPKVPPTVVQLDPRFGATPGQYYPPGPVPVPVPFSLPTLRPGKFPSSEPRYWGMG